MSRNPAEPKSDVPGLRSGSGLRRPAGAPFATLHGVGTPAARKKLRLISALRRLPYLLRLLRRSAVSDAKLPHSRFSATTFGIRSLVVAGSGSPTVVFESGIGQGKRNWAPVFNQVSEITQAVAYDRAGYGQSEASE